MQKEDEPQKTKSQQKVNKIFNYTLLVFFLGLMCGGCISPLHSQAVDVDSEGWNKEVEFEFQNGDTLLRHDMSLFLRTNLHFREDSLTVKIRFSTPDSLTYKEAFEMHLQPKKHPSAIMHELKVDYRTRLHFQKKGTYKVGITPTRKVEGIEAVGINFKN